MTDNKTVTFNVGGKKFEVSRSLLEIMHPNTLLARSASDQWKDDPESEIFLDMDSSRFGYCLDYLRHSRVILPLTVAKKAVLADLEYIGVQKVEEIAIDDSHAIGEQALKAVESVMDNYDAKMSYYKEQTSDHEDELKKVEEQQKCLEFAKICFLKYGENRSPPEYSLNSQDPNFELLKTFAQCKGENRDAALDHFGLRLKTISWTNTTTAKVELERATP